MSDQFAGRNILIKVDLDNVGGLAANWQDLPAQMDGDLDRKSKQVSTNNKQDDGWDSSLATGRGWTVSCSGAIDPKDPVWRALILDWRNSRKRWIKIDRTIIGGESEEGQANVEIKEGMGNEDLLKFDCTFTGNGKLVRSPQPA